MLKIFRLSVELCSYVEVTKSPKQLLTEEGVSAPGPLCAWLRVSSVSRARHKLFFTISYQKGLNFCKERAQPGQHRVAGSAKNRGKQFNEAWEVQL